MLFRSTALLFLSLCPSLYQHHILMHHLLQAMERNILYGYSFPPLRPFGTFTLLVGDTPSPGKIHSGSAPVLLRLCLSAQLKAPSGCASSPCYFPSLFLKIDCITSPYSGNAFQKNFPQPLIFSLKPSSTCSLFCKKSTVFLFQSPGS